MHINLIIYFSRERRSVVALLVVTELQKCLWGFITGPLKSACCELEFSELNCELDLR
jgi:hypothetical protein